MKVNCTFRDYFIFQTETVKTKFLNFFLSMSDKYNSKYFMQRYFIMHNIPLVSMYLWRYKSKLKRQVLISLYEKSFTLNFSHELKYDRKPAIMKILSSFLLL